LENWAELRYARAEVLKFKLRFDKKLSSVSFPTGACVDVPILLSPLFIYQFDV